MVGRNVEKGRLYKTRLDQLIRVKRKRYKVTVEKLKYWSKAKAATLKRYTNIVK